MKTQTATVPVKSAWTSKINYTQVVGIAATVLAVISGNKYQVPAEQQLIIVGVIQGVVAIATWILKTWFTGTVSAASLPAKKMRRR